MTMSMYRILFVVILSSILLSYHTSTAGPARSIAMAASRAIKIPRSIRAPFRNSEMMTARGFGKRALYPSSTYDTNYKDNTREARMKFRLDDGNLRIGRGFGKRSGDKEYTGPWSYPKHEDLATGDSDPMLQMFNEQPIESFPIEWFANEISSNPALIKSILRRAVDTNRDGMLTINELFGGSQLSSENSGTF